MSEGGTSQPIGGSGDSGATVQTADIKSSDPPSPPPPTTCRTSDIYSGIVCGRGASYEVMEMIFGKYS